jgi:hypothetical protein
VLLLSQELSSFDIDALDSILLINLSSMRIWHKPLIKSKVAHKFTFKLLMMRLDLIDSKDNISKEDCTAKGRDSRAGKGRVIAMSNRKRHQRRRIVLKKRQS